MSVSFKRELKFFFIRYVPDAVREDFVNIGLVLFDPKSPASAQVRFRRDWSPVHSLDPDADLDLLRALESDLHERLASRPDTINFLQDTLSNTLRTTAPETCMAESAAEEADRLAAIYLS